jgi:hypothetical protein
MGKSKGQSPQARTKAWLRSIGLVEWTVETRVHIPGATFPPTRDFCNFADLMAFDDLLTIAIQVTSTSNLADRMRKVLDEPMAYVWAMNEKRSLWVVGWREYAEAADDDPALWRPTIVTLTPANFEDEVKEAAQKLIEAD